MNMNIMSMNMNIGLMNMNGRCEHSYEYELYELFYFWAIYVLPVPPRVPTQTKTATFYPIPPSRISGQITCYSFLQFFSLNLYVFTLMIFENPFFPHGSRNMTHH